MRFLVGTVGLAAVIRLQIFEDRFRVAIPDEEVGQRAFASVRALVDFILAEQAR